MTNEPQSLEWRDAPSNAGPRAYWLCVKNESMVAPRGAVPTFPPGTYICVDPDIAPEDGCYVVARVQGSATLKQYVDDPPDRMLRPLNPDFSSIPMTDDVEILGVVVRYEFDLR